MRDICYDRYRDLDGDWACSLDKGHGGRHKAHMAHDLNIPHTRVWGKGIVTDICGEQIRHPRTGSNLGCTLGKGHGQPDDIVHEAWGGNMLFGSWDQDGFVEFMACAHHYTNPDTKRDHWCEAHNGHEGGHTDASYGYREWWSNAADRAKVKPKAKTPAAHLIGR